MLRSVPLLAVLALALAGCVTPPASTLDPAAADVAAGSHVVVPPAPDFDFSTVIDPDHASHQLPALHTGGKGLELVGMAPIQEILAPGTRGSITQVDVWENYAVVSGMEGGLAFAIVDITDPAKPKAVSWFPSAADGWTARFSADGQYVFYGCQMLGTVGYPLTQVKGTCEDPDALHPPGMYGAGGVIAVDVSDKAAPKFVDFLPGMAAHNLFVANISGTDFIFTNGVNIIKFDREAQELVEVANVPGVHDATVRQHPVTGDWLLFTGTSQLSIYNVNDPASPEPVFVPEEGDESEWTGWHEQTLVPGLVDGRAILILAGECFAGESTPGPLACPKMDEVAIVDVTDPTTPTLLGKWLAPFKPEAPWVSYLYSAHEIAATPSGQVAISWYHAGVWVIDVSTKERQAEPVTLAAYQPNGMMNAVPSTFVQTPVPYVPFVWGAGWDERGYLVVPDMQTGLYVLEPEWGLHPSLSGGQ